MSSTAAIFARRDDRDEWRKLGMRGKRDNPLCCELAWPAKTRSSGLDAVKTHTRPNNHMTVVPDEPSLSC